MTTNTRSTIHLLAAACLLAVAVLADPVLGQDLRTVDAAALRAGNIEGTLMPPEGSGKDVAGVTVTILETGTMASVDKRGHFEFTAVQPGTYTLIATGEGYSRLRITDVVVRPNHSLMLGTEVMPMILRNGEVITMQEVVVSARKDVEVMEKYVVFDEKQQPFVGTSNLDLPRTINDAQPYYMWDSTQIENSGARDVQDFFQRMVPMNTNRASSSQSSTGTYNNSNINLGGFGGTNGTSTGTQNTLILVNGLPLPSFASATLYYQPDVNGVPLAAIDHIEVLPSSASAIYGASAAGGVVNIVLKHEYTGGELAVSYDNPAQGHAPTKGISLTLGKSLEGGKTNVLFSANYNVKQPLVLQDRLSQIVSPYQARYFGGYPGGELGYIGIATNGSVTSASSAFLGQPLIVSTSGSPLFAGKAAVGVQVPVGYAAGSGLAPLQANIGNYNLAHPSYSGGAGIGGLRDPIEAGTTEKSFELLVRRNMTHWLEAYVQFSNSSNQTNDFYDFFSLSATMPATAPENPFGQAVKVTGVEPSNLQPYRNDLVTRTVSMGATISLPHLWKADLNYTAGSTNAELSEQLGNFTALQAAVTAGAVNPITDLTLYPFNAAAYSEIISISSVSSVDALQLKAAGPLMKLWAGAPSLALGVEHRKSGAGDDTEAITFPGVAAVPGIASTATASQVLYFPGKSESDDSGYVELTFPLVAKANRIPAINQLELQAAGRFDRLQEFTTSPVDEAITTRINGTSVNSPSLLGGGPEPFTNNTTNYRSTNGTIGFKYKPVDAVSLRASYSTAFVPPVYTQLLAPISTGTQTQTTGAYPGVPTTSPWGYQSITDPLLGATYTVPVETGGNSNLKPETSRGFDWGIILEPSFLSGFRLSLDYTKVTKHDDILIPSVATLIGNPGAYPGTVTRGSPNAGQAVGPIVLVTDTYINAPQTWTSSYNLEVDYTFKTAAAGTFKLSGIGNFW